MLKKNNRASTKSGGNVVHLGRGKRPYYVERGEHGEFRSIKGPVEAKSKKM